MPRLDGIALALKLGKSRPQLPILMMTGYAHERQRAHDLEVLVHRVLTKPFTVDQFRTALRDALTGSETEPTRAAGWA
jgi:DNA-binding response OmpR family regulator